MFEQMDIGDKNFIMNSGSYFILMSIMCVHLLGCFLINFMTARCPKIKTFRKLGMRVYYRSYTRSLMVGQFKLFLESYFDLSICGILGVFAFIEFDSIDVFFQSRDDIACTVLTILYTFFVLIFPVYTYRRVKSNFKRLFTKKTQKWYGYIIEDVSTKSVDQSLYNVYFMLRRFMLAVVLIFM